MIKILFFIAAALLHFPHTFYGETLNRYTKMKMYNPLKALQYELVSGRLEGDSWIILNSVLAYIFALIPLSFIINIHWLFLIIVNWLWGSFIIPIMTFALYPIGVIYSKRQLKFITLKYFILAVALIAFGLMKYLEKRGL